MNKRLTAILTLAIPCAGSAVLADDDSLASFSLPPGSEVEHDERALVGVDALGGVLIAFDD